MATRNSIVNGPSKFDLMVALLDGDMNHRKEVIFSLPIRDVETRVDPRVDPSFRKVIDDLAAARKLPTDGTFPTQPIIINGIRREDGSGGNWLFEGHCGSGDSYRKVRGFYSTTSRRGWIEHKTGDEK